MGSPHLFQLKKGDNNLCI